MNLLLKMEEFENRLKEVEALSKVYPTWISMTSHFASQYGYSLDGLRNFCLTNIEPELFKKFGKTYSIHKSALYMLRKK